MAQAGSIHAVSQCIVPYESGQGTLLPLFLYYSSVAISGRLILNNPLI